MVLPHTSFLILTKFSNLSRATCENFQDMVGAQYKKIKHEERARGSTSVSGCYRVTITVHIKEGLCHRVTRAVATGLDPTQWPRWISELTGHKWRKCTC